MLMPKKLVDSFTSVIAFLRIFDSVFHVVQAAAEFLPGDGWILKFTLTYLDFCFSPLALEATQVEKAFLRLKSGLDGETSTSTPSILNVANSVSSEPSVPKSLE